MDDSETPTSAVEAVRCLYLARVMERRGEAEAAQRWYAKAFGWTDAVITASSSSRGGLKVEARLKLSGPDEPCRS